MHQKHYALTNAQGTNYRQALDQIDEKLIGNKIYIDAENPEDTSPGWAKWAMGFFSLATGNVAGVALAAVGFSWKNILVNWLAVIGISSLLIIFTGIIINPVGIALTSLGVGAIQTELARKELLRVTKTEFIKTLPEIAQKQKETIRETVEDCFNSYYREITKRINEDIKARQTELDLLLATKATEGKQQEQEIQRLQGLDKQVSAEYQEIQKVL